ncbi:MAG TPA: hypothetical protein VMU50_17805 [Polyangia bacterium]|nr:hypothetical protein [Polyangia bacterium]
MKRRRALVLAGIIVAMGAVAALVARPRVPPPAAVPYAGARGGSLAKAAGLIAYGRRGDETWPLAPGAALRPGDEVLLKVRTDRPRYLEVRVRGGGPDERTIFPAKGATLAALVTSGEALPLSVPIDDKPGRLVIVGHFADHAFPVGQAPAPDLLAVVIEVPKEK